MVTPDDICAMVEASGLSQQAWARTLEIAPSTFRRWLAGGPIPFPSQLAMRYLAEHNELLDRSTEGHVGGPKSGTRPAKHK